MRGFIGLVIVALLLAGAYYAGWFDFSHAERPGERTVGVTIHQDRIEKNFDDADRALSNAGERARNAIHDTTTAPANSGKPRLKVSRYAIALETGGQADVIVTRIGGNLPATALAIATSPGSNLVVSGGKFDAGERQTTLTIAAPPGAVDGRVDLSSGAARESITVEVKTQPASMWNENIVWPRPRETFRF